METEILTKQDLINEFWKNVEETAEGLGLGIGPDCADHIRTLIEMGAERIEREGSIYDSQQLTKARNHLIAFVGGMAFEAKRLNLSMLREVTFHAAHASFCPLWPFC